MKTKLFLTVFLILVGGCFSHVSAQFSARVNTERIGLQDVVMVTYSFHGRGLQHVSLPDFDNFQVVSTSQSMTNNIDHDFVVALAPLRTGKFTIPAALATANGREYESNKLTVEVVKGTLQPNNAPVRRQQQQQRMQQQSIEEEIARMEALMRRMMGNVDEDWAKAWEDMNRRQEKLIREYERMNAQPRQPAELEHNLFVKAIADRTSVYIGEPIEVTYKIYNRYGNCQGNITKLPALKGFWSKDYEVPMPPKEKVEVFGGAKYLTYLIKRSQLYPTQAGALILDPMEFTANVFNYGQVKLNSAPVSIQVKPLPANQPATFTGAVGKYGVSSLVQNGQLTTNDIGTLVLTVNGSGNMDLVSAPVFTFPEGVVAGEPVVSSNNAPSPDAYGKKTFTYNFSVEEPGEYEIPSIPFTYFDPRQESYITIQTEPIRINIKEGDVVATKNDKGLAKKRGLQEITEGALPVISTSRPFTATVAYWSIWAAVLAAAPVLMLYKKRKDKMAANPHLYKDKANKVAFERLARARQLLSGSGSHQAFYEEVSKSIWLYLSDKLKIPMSELRKEMLVMKLREKSIDENMISRTQQIITECEMALYSPIGGIQQKEQVLQEATQLISSFEQQLH